MTTALIAEDEPLLAQALQAELARAWPGLKVLATVGDGAAAVARALALQPDVLFFDIQMPGLNGLDAAAELADAWPAPQQAGGKPFPALVFVTAYDQYAVQAFEAQAMDYLLKPVQPARLQKTVQKVQLVLMQRAHSAINSEAELEHTLGQLRALLAPASAAGMAAGKPLQMIQASQPGSQGGTIQMIPLAEVLYFEAADKYIRVLTADAEYLIRTPLKELLPQLDAHTFWQVHRGTVVRASAIASVQRDDSGRLTLTLRGSPDRLAVSRLYSHLFRAM
ncbi:LytTR family DNA-binding domain-containing protein [Polaromonas sp.]|uniref:LytR/AlgR family response regulator transcription factor n=1 Tax=Polaromonas sp. TaxID=1869339 RepID=UPI00286BF937|nr:LytTR family DNA-binding domain-containing protein [Polaromonas sp.]